MRLSPICTAALAAAAWASQAAAQPVTLAYWRFEDPGAANGLPVPAPPSGQNGGPYSPYLIDSSGSNNQLRTFATDTPDTRPRWTNFVPPTPLSSGAANNFALDFTPNQDLYTGTGVAGSPNLNSFNFTGNWTIEASFLPRALNRFHGIVGKDGSPAGSPLATVQMKLRDDNDLFQIEIRDAADVARSVTSLVPPTVGQWYNLAAVSNGSTLSLYLRGPGDSDYVLQGSIATNGGILNNGDANWTVGRGFFNNGITDWADGLIDEVRITSGALTPAQFLFAQPIPEPSSLALAGAAALAAWRLRRKK